MSRTMQLTVEVNAHYQDGFAATYPNLARHLEVITPGLLGPGPSLFEISRRVDELVEKLQGTRLGELLEADASALRRDQIRVEQLLADWKLAEADQLLYGIEDRFGELESELARD
jgi:hypothetical protein